MGDSNVTSHATRGQSAGALLARAIFMGIGHALQQAGALKLLLVIGTLFLCLGVAGLIDPRLLLGFTPEGKKKFPLWVHVTAWLP